jgi:hypothetical protein
VARDRDDNDGEAEVLVRGGHVVVCGSVAVAVSERLPKQGRTRREERTLGERKRRDE